MTDSGSSTFRTLGDWRIGDPPPGSSWGEPRVPSCPLDRGDAYAAHDFTDYTPPLGGPALIYCRNCGEVRKLEVPG